VSGLATITNNPTVRRRQAPFFATLPKRLRSLIDIIIINTVQATSGCGLANMEDPCKAPPSAIAIEEPLPNGKGAAVGGGGAVHFKIELPEEELLGSVTTHNCPGTRASARVIQKMKQDQTRPMTPPPNERELSKKDEKAAQKTPSQLRTGSGKTTWTNVERNCFFDALNEFGKDFEAVANCINAKLKRRNASSDYSFKTKDQVRQHYYQTYHKICKYVRYSEGKQGPSLAGQWNILDFHGMKIAN